MKSIFFYLSHEDEAEEDEVPTSGVAHLLSYMCTLNLFFFSRKPIKKKKTPEGLQIERKATFVTATLKYQQSEKVHSGRPGGYSHMGGCRRCRC